MSDRKEYIPALVRTFTRTSAFCCVLYLSISGCGMPPEPESASESHDAASHTNATDGTQRPKWLLLPLPSDLSTDTLGSPVGLMVVNTDRASGRAPSEAELIDLARTLSLTTLDGSPVAAEVQVIAPPSHDPTGVDGDLGDRPDYDRHVRLELHPRDALKPVWHSIRLAKPDSAFSPTGFYLTQDNDGNLASRFHPLPMPIFRAVRILAQQQEKPTRLELEFSQPVDREQTESSVVLCGASRCDAALPEGISAVHERIWQFTCSCAPDEAITLAIRQPILTTAGELVRTLAGAAVFEVAWPADPAWQRDGDFWAMVP